MFTPHICYFFARLPTALGIATCMVAASFAAPCDAQEPADEMVNSVPQGLELAADSFQYCSPPCRFETLFGDDFWTRPTLTNGLGGTLPSLAEEGIIYNAFLTQFYQGVAAGGTEQEFLYGGKLDQFVNFDGEKLGLWKGFLVTMHSETRFGQDVNQTAVGFAPVNLNMLYPSSNAETAITGLLFTQFLSEEWAVSAGKFNLIDLLAQLYPQTGRGIDGFMNVSTLFPLSSGLGLNLSVMGASVTKLNEGRVQGTLAVGDTHNSATTTGFHDLFAEGAVVVGYYRFFTEFGSLPGSHGLMGVYSSGTFTSVDQESIIFVPGKGLVLGSADGTWNLAYFCEQKVWVDPCNQQRNVGLLSTLGISDGNPNPVQWAGNITLQGQGLSPRRLQDTMGLAYFYTGLSSDFKELVSPPLNLRDVQGGELYYNAAITPWFHLTADLQIIQPADRTNNTAYVMGLRAKISF